MNNDLSMSERLTYSLAQLTPPQQDYALEYVIHGNAGESARAAGVSYSTGLKWATNPWIVAYCGLIKLIRAENAELSYSEIEHHHAIIIRSDPGDYWTEELYGEYFDEQGALVQRTRTRLKRMPELTLRQRQCIKKICYDKQAIELYSRTDALNAVAKLNGYDDNKAQDDDLAPPVTSVTFAVRDPVAIPENIGSA